MNWRQRLTGLLLTAASIASLAQDKPVELRFAHWMPAQHDLARLGFEPWARSVEAASKGSIRVVIYPAQQLGKAADHYDLARDGIADLAWVSPGYQAGRFPIFAASELPLMISVPGSGSEAVDTWYRKYAASEMKDVKYCFAHLHVGAFHSKKPVTEPDQLKGMKVRSSNGMISQYMTLNGATNVQVAAVEARDALEKGVADALTFPWHTLSAFGVDKAVKYHTDLRIYAGTFAWVLNRGWYDKLSASQKAVVDDHCSSRWANRVGAAWGDFEDEGINKIRNSPGHTILNLTSAQLSMWKASAKPVADQWGAAVTKAGGNSKLILDELRGELAKHKALY